ncbi:3-hydroxyacyl-ACP dehydratase [Niabella terrae]
MLIDHLFIIQSFETATGRVRALVGIQPEHPIFEGHFPGQPVLPGVCQLQLIKELLEKTLDKKLFLQEAAQCKFLQMVDPRQTNQLEVEISFDDSTPGSVSVQGQLRSASNVFLKMNGSYLIRN